MIRSNLSMPPAKDADITSLRDLEKLLTSLHNNRLVTTLTASVAIHSLNVRDIFKFCAILSSLSVLNVEITEVALLNCRLPERFFMTLSEICSSYKFPSHLSLMRCTFKNVPDVCFTSFPLKSLVVSVERNTTEVLPQLLQINTLTSVSMRTVLYAIPVQQLISILQRPGCRIQHLALDCYFTGRSAAFLSTFLLSLPHFTSLTSLQMTFSRPFDLNIEEAMVLCSLRSLRSLSIEGSTRLSPQVLYILHMHPTYFFDIS